MFENILIGCIVLMFIWLYFQQEFAYITIFHAANRDHLHGCNECKYKIASEKCMRNQCFASLQQCKQTYIFCYNCFIAHSPWSTIICELFITLLQKEKAFWHFTFLLNTNNWRRKKTYGRRPHSSHIALISTVKTRAPFYETTNL